MAARITPTCDPMPPSTTIARISADSMKVKDPGLTRPWRAAKNAPPKPANMAPMVKAESLKRVGFRPRERQPISRSEEHTPELQSLMPISYAVVCLTKKHDLQPQHHRTPSNHKQPPHQPYKHAESTTN